MFTEYAISPVEVVGCATSPQELADLGYWSPDALDSLLRTHPDFCQPLLAILGAKIAESHEVERTLLTREKQPSV